MTTRISKRLLLLPALILLSVSGCFGYHVGTTSLYDKRIRTVYVPMVQADSYRHGLGESLTEAITKRITQRTPYTLGTASSADSVLIVHLFSERQNVSGKDRYNETRQKTLNWQIAAEWRDSEGGTIKEITATPITSLGITMTTENYMVAEMGQSYATSSQEMVEKIADRVVGLMEEPW